MTTRPRVAVVATVGVAMLFGLAAWWVLIRPFGEQPATPDPFGTIEQVYASLPQSMQLPRVEDGSIPSPMLHRRNATLNRFTGEPAQIEPFLQFLESDPVASGADGEAMDAYHADIAERATALRALARAWVQADFSADRARVLALALCYTSDDSEIIRGQAGVLLLAMQPFTEADGGAGKDAEALFAEDGPYDEHFVAVWDGVLEHARQTAGTAVAP